jgi:hypothetical protein
VARLRAAIPLSRNSTSDYRVQAKGKTLGLTTGRRRERLCVHNYFLSTSPIAFATLVLYPKLQETSMSFAEPNQAHQRGTAVSTEISGLVLIIILGVGVSGPA